LDEAAQAEPVRQSEKDTHDIEGTETVHATVPKRSVYPGQTQSVFQSLSFQALLVTRVYKTHWLLNHLDEEVYTILLTTPQHHNLLPAVRDLIEIGQWLLSLQTLTKTGQRYSLEDSILAALMMIDLNGSDIEAVDEVKALILESVNTWKNYKKRMPSRSNPTEQKCTGHK